MEICSNDKCFGCSLCSFVCPVKAISMSDEKGFYRPIVNNEKCINCGLCSERCIGNKRIELPFIDNSMPCYAAYSIDQNTQFDSTSGGICTEISKQFILDGGIVIGAWWNPDKQKVEHRLCETLEDLNLIKKSKYVQSKIDNIYLKVIDIIKDKKSLFIGTPCQVYALKQIVNKNSDRLFCIDLLCRGGSSPKCLSEHISNICKGKADYISFRGGEDDCYLTIIKNGKKIYRGPQYIDPYFNYFMEHYLFQPICFNCPFAGKKRMGDITLGDFWGLSEEVLTKAEGRGINLVLINNKKGEWLFKSIREKTISIKRDPQEAFDGNDTLKNATIMPKEYYEVWKKINEKGFCEGINYFDKNNYSKRVIKSYIDFYKFKVKRIIGKI